MAMFLLGSDFTLEEGVTPPLVKNCTLRMLGNGLLVLRGRNLRFLSPASFAPVVIASQVDVLPLER